MKKILVTRSIIPNMFTLMNLFGGFLAIIHTAQDEFTKAAWFIVMGAIFDALDGAVARLTNSTSELGMELDSLCDAITFTVAPAFMLHQAYFHELGSVGTLLAVLPAFAGVTRLARFNIQVSGFEDKNYFMGMPTPAGALVIISYLLFYHITDRLPEEAKPYTIIGITVLTSIAMISTVKFDNAPRFTKKGFRQRPIATVLFILGGVLSAISKGVLVFPFMSLYLIGGFMRHGVNYWLMKRRASQEDESEDTLEAPDPDPFDV
jgi:CDP-diacylglycerol--serine O-phosphatidyltransferase